MLYRPCQQTRFASAKQRFPKRRRLQFPLRQSRGGFQQQRLIQTAPNILPFPPVQPGMAVLLHIYIGKEAFSQGRFGRPNRQLFHPTRFISRTHPHIRTDGTVRRSGDTLKRPKIHNSLIIIIRPAFVQQFLGQGGDSLFTFRAVRRDIYPKNPRQYTLHISVHYGIRHMIGKRTNRGGRIIAHPF